MTEEPDLGRMIAYCAHLGMRYSEKLLRRDGYDVTPVQSHVLMYLSRQGGKAVNQRELEKELHLKPSTVNGIVTRLEEKGCVARRTSPTDGRCRLVSLTEAGQNRVDAFRTVLASTGQRYASFLAEEEEAALRTLLSCIIEKLENEVNKL